MEELLTRVADHLIRRLNDPMKFRLLLQPATAAIFAIRGGLRDARQHRPAYFWALFTQPAARQQLIEEAWQDVGKVFTVALLIDVVYQLLMFHWVYPGEAVIVSISLALVPYILLRGPINRVASHYLAD